MTWMHHPLPIEEQIALGIVGILLSWTLVWIRMLRVRAVPTPAASGAFYPLSIFSPGALDEHVIHEVVASTLHAVPRGVTGVWDTADLVAVPLDTPGAVLHRTGGTWAVGTICWLPAAGDPLRRCVETAAEESTDWREWLDRKVKRS